MNTEIQEIVSIVEHACEQFSPWCFSATQRLNNGSTTNPAASVIFRTNILTQTGALVEVRVEHLGGEIYVIGTHAGDTFFFESYPTVDALRKNVYADLRYSVECKISGPANEISILYSMVRELMRNVERLEKEVSRLSSRVDNEE